MVPVAPIERELPPQSNNRDPPAPGHPGHPDEPEPTGLLGKVVGTCAMLCVIAIPALVAAPVVIAGTIMVGCVMLAGAMITMWPVVVVGAIVYQTLGPLSACIVIGSIVIFHVTH